MSFTPNRAKDNPKLRERAIADGKKTLYLEYYDGYTKTPKLDSSGLPLVHTDGNEQGQPIYEIKAIRHKETLTGLYLYSKPRTAEERAHNKSTLMQAQKIRNEREQEILSGKYGYKGLRTNQNLIAHFESYLASYALKDIRNIKLSLNRFKTFLRLKYPLFVLSKTETECKRIREEWQDRHKGINGRHEINENEFYIFNLPPRLFTEDMVKEFVVFLQENSTGSGAASAYKRFKKMVRYITKEGYLAKNPCEDIVCKGDESFTKEILNDAEIQQLLNTHYTGENPNIRRAFLFTLYTGVRWCDVKELRFFNVDFQNKTLKFEQAKTKGRSAKSVVEMPLTDGVLQYIIGQPKGVNDLIFPLPSHTMCLKALRAWTKKAGITKHITWHCGRHSFATQLLENGANIKVVADLLGHSGLEYVERYVRAIDESKKQALNSLPTLKF